jgi:hypothetical protein
MNRFTLKASVLAVQGALALLVAAPAVRAQEDADVQALTNPASQIQAGVVVVSKDSAKAGEYNGLDRRGARPDLSFDLRGGAAWDAADATRWRLFGSDLGLMNRSLQAQYGEQGRFRLDLGYDSIVHQLSDSYQTPYLGAGGTTLTLPGSWQAPLFQTGAAMGSGNTYPAPSASMLGLAATSTASPLVTGTAYICRGTTNGCAVNPALGNAYTTGYVTTNAANVAMLAQNQTDLGDFHAQGLSTRRERTRFATSVNFSHAWDGSIGLLHEDKRGLKQLGVVNSGNGGYATENAVVIPELVDTSTEQFNAALNYHAAHGFATLAYNGTLFTNHAKAMSLDNPYASGSYGGVAQAGYGVAGAMITEEPDSTYHQVRATGGLDLGSRTHLVGDLAIGRSAQNDAFILDPAVFATPSGAASPATANGTVLGANSAHAAVVTRNFDLKLTSRPLDRLRLAAAYKFDERENQTPVNTYAWYDAGAKNFGAPSGSTASPLGGATIAGIPAATPLYSGVNIVANRPYSRRVNQLDASADYELGHGQSLRAGANYAATERWCAGTWIDCSFADQARDKTASLEYRFRLTATVNGRISGEVGRRNVDYNPNAWMSLVPALGATNIPGLVAASGGAWNGSVLGFLNANGLAATGLPITANTPSGLTGNALLTYQALYGTGNGSLSNNYYGNHNVTANWPGLEVANMADRDHHRLRASADWQVSERLALQGSADYRHEKYPQSVYGLQGTDRLAFNLDGDFAASDSLALGAYATLEDQVTRTAGNSGSNGSVSAVTAANTGPAYVTGSTLVGTTTARNTLVTGLCAADSASVTGITSPTPYQVYGNNVKVDPCNTWSTQMHDRVGTVGLSATQRAFLVPQLTLKGEASYSRAVGRNNVGGGFYYANPLATYTANVPAMYYVRAQAMPDTITTTVRLRMNADYAASRNATLRLSWGFSRLTDEDYQYATNLPAGTSGTVMPTFVAAPNYVVQVVGVSYILRMQ